MVHGLFQAKTYCFKIETMEIHIDPDSGFCFGVVSAVDEAEKELKRSGALYCLGEIVHNKAELERLQNRGLITIQHKDLPKIRNKTMLIRAHGESPDTYRIADENNINIIDASCPIVLKLQRLIKKVFSEMKSRNGQIVIFGEPGHPETIGLLGQTNRQAIVLRSISDVHKIDTSRPVALFSQTTKSVEEYHLIASEIKNFMKPRFPREDVPLEVYNTICRQVSKRLPRIKKFCKNHDIIIFVSGRNSSNGKILFKACREKNPLSHSISTASELKPEWFTNASSVGICGATSTPMWLMKEVARKIEDISPVK